MPWQYSGRPRVLIEHPDPDAGLELASALRRAGCTVAICRGPDPTGNPARCCPLHGLEPCVVVEGADVVVTALGLDQEDSRGVLHGLRTRYPSTPVVVEATAADTLELSDLLEGCTVVAPRAESKHVVTAVLDALSP